MPKALLLVFFIFSKVFSMEAPKNVLVGTDIISFKNISISKECSEDSILGKYLLELGGATAKIIIKKGVVSRSIQEPGEPADTKVYKMLKRDNCHWTTDTFNLYKVKGGVLIWEKKPETDSISSKLWLLYNISK